MAPKTSGRDCWRAGPGRLLCRAVPGVQMSLLGSVGGPGVGRLPDGRGGVELRAAIEARRMERRTTTEPLTPGDVHALLDLARRAPTAGNAQGIDFVVVLDARRRAALADLAGEADYVDRGFHPWLSAAPVHVVPCVDVRRYRARYDEPDKSGAGVDEWSVPYWWMDLGAAVQTLLLLATEAGWAAAFLGAHAVPGLAAALALPDGVHAAGVVTLGRPHPDGARPTASEDRPRRPVEEVVHPEVW